MLIDLQIIGRKIKESRLKSNISQAELARRANVSRATISGIENATLKEIGVNRLNRVLLASNSVSNMHVHVCHSSRKSATLNLSFPYDWSNSFMPDTLLIEKVVERGLFEDMARVAAQYGTELLRSSVLVFSAKNPAAAPSLNRMLSNIEKGLHAQA